MRRQSNPAAAGLGIEQSRLKAEFDILARGQVDDREVPTQLRPRDRGNRVLTSAEQEDRVRRIREQHL